MEKGILKANGVHLANHEYNTVKLLTENGYDVELIPTSVIKGLRMPDIMINNVPWETSKKYHKPNVLQNLLF